QVGGLSALFAHPAVAGHLSLLPDFSDWSTAAAVLLVPLAVQWWSTWYPGAEPGGGGYVAQRMLAAPTERDAMRTTLLFDVLHYVRVGRAVTVGLIALASALSLWLQNSYQAFQILLQIGAGTGLIFLLRWFWWRVNAWSEIAGMMISFVVAVYFQFVHRALGLAPLTPTRQLVIGVAITTVGWLAVTFATPPTDRATLQTFYDRIRPMGPGWNGAVTTRPANAGESVTAAFLCWFLGCAVIYAALFGTGYLLYGKSLPGIVCLVAAGAAAWGLFRALPRVGFE